MLSATLRRSFIIAAAIVPIAQLSLRTASADARYWDPVNGTAAGAGTAPVGTFDTVANTPAAWNPLPDGTGTPVTIASTDDAVFSAGSDATGAFLVTLGSAVTVNSVLVEEGNITLGGTSISTTNNFTIGTGAGSAARVNVSTSTRFAGTSKIFLDGGTLYSTNATTGNGFIPVAKGLEITANGGTVGTDDGTTNVIADIFGGSTFGTTTGVITGTGGTTTNGGVGTLTKVGTDEFRYQNSGTANTTFAKLVVKEGIFRLGSVTSGSTQATSELGFGAAPLAALPDAITLDGGQIGASFVVTLNANRGITVTNNGGTLLGSMTIPSLLSGSGALSIANSASIALSNVGNVTSFTGSLVLNGGATASTLTLNSSLNATNLSGTAGAAKGTVAIAAGQTLTVGSDNTSTSYGGGVSGSGTFTKVGNGTLTLIPTTGDFTNTGPTNINAGTIKYGSASAGLNGGSVITIAGGATLDMNNVGDTIGPLAGAGSVLKGATGGLLTLGGTTSTTFSGTISGGGNLAKAGTGTQTFSGNNGYTGTTTVTAGTLLLASTSGPALSATTGVTVTGNLTLGAANQINDAALVTLNGGTLATGGFSDAVGAAMLAANSIIDLGTGASDLAFADSSAATWAGTLLKIYNYTGTPLVGGGVDQLYFGTTASLSLAQLADIKFYADAGTTLLGGATQLADGEVVPAVNAPEPATLAAIAGVATLGLIRRRRA